MENTLSPCGIDCANGECKEYGKTCKGCNSIKGEIFWAKYMGAKICPIYDCSVNDNKHSHCGQCEKLPCKIHYDCKDPSLTDEQHKEGINKRAALLKSKK